MEKTKFMGVYSRKSVGKRKKGKKVDTCFYITYRKPGERKLLWEKAGWAGEGYTPKLASELRAERLRMMRHGQELPKERAKVPLFSEMAKKYLEWAKENKCRDTDDKGRYENHLKAPLGKKRLSEISSFDLERLKSKLIAKRLASATVKHCLVLVREIFNKAKEWGKYQGDHPLRGVKMPVLSNKRERFLSHEEADLLLKELAKSSIGKPRTDGSRNTATHDQALLALHCGLRAGEIFNLRAQELDFKNGLIRIMDPKNNENRTAYMTETVKEMLRTRIEKNKGEYVFAERGSGGKVKTISQTFDRAVEKLGFNKGIEDPRQKVVFHTLRHTFGSWLAIQGTPILTIKELMGHKTLAMTERYAHLSPGVKKEATLALESGFESSRNGNKVLPMAKGKETST
jgi:integrase